jgi:hypothetical protein
MVFMEKPNVLTYYRGKHGYNCAQAVLKAFAPSADLDQFCMDRFSHFGSGRAPAGECGALFAAKALFGDSVTKQEVEKAFVDTAGSTRCRDIRKGRTISCEQCVQTAADVVFVRLTQGSPLQRPSECVSQAELLK